jgi:hypothetical protein
MNSARGDRSECGLDRDDAINFVKVFSATKVRERNELGERVTAWLQEHPGVTNVEAVVRLSSDKSFHCLSIVLFAKLPQAA